jgi:chlorobactene glucosyltransferase
MGIFTLSLVRPHPAPQRLSSPPKVSVIVPARDEASNIGRCLTSLLQQDYENYEVVAVDDRSVDDTASIIADLAAVHQKLKLVHGDSAPPDGWTGKCHAINQALRVADGDWLLFADADTVHTPSSISLAVSCATSTRAHMVSFWPLHEVGTFWEKLITPILWGTFFWSDAFQSVNDLSYDTAYAVGHCIFIERRAYEFVGGHEAVREWIIEDHALAKLVKRKGLHLIMADGRHLLQVRMYTNLKNLWHGWSKMLYACLEYDNWLLLALVVMLIGTLISPFATAAYLAAANLSGTLPDQPELLIQLCGIELLIVFMWWLIALSHCKGGRWWYFPLAPLGAAILVACYLRSFQMVNSGAEVNWKGRKYRVSKLKVPGIN